MNPCKVKNILRVPTIYGTLLLSLLFVISFASEFSSLVQVIENPKVNQLATYRFTLFATSGTVTSFAAGTKFQTYFPSTVAMQATSGAISVCRLYNQDTSTTTTLSGCTYSSSDSSLSFTLQNQLDFGFQFDYELGQIKNPSSAIQVSGFRILIKTASGTVIDDLSDGNFYVQSGEITGQSVTPSSFKVADLATYTFKFQINDALPGDCMFDITFPSTDISLPTTLTNADTSVQVYDRTQITGTIAYRKNNILTFLNPLANQAQTPDNTKYITVTIAKIINPKSTKTTPSFMIQTLDAQDNTIDIADSGMTIKMTQAGDITLSNGTPKNLVQPVNQVTNLQFDITLGLKYDSGGYMLITIPSEIRLQSNINCYYLQGFEITQACTVYQTSPYLIIKITSTLKSSPMNIIFILGQFYNPSTNKPTSTFQIQAFDSLGNLICEKTSGITYAATPAALTSVSAVRSLSEINVMNGNALTISFTTVSSIVNGEYIWLKIPYDQMLVDASSFACKVKTGSNTLTTQSCSLDTSTSTTHFIVTMLAPCSTTCSGSTAYQVQLTGIRNPGWIIPTQTRSIEIQLMTSDLLWIKDRKNTAVFTTPDLTEGQITAKSLSKGNSIVNQATDFTVTFTTLNLIPANGLIKLQLPTSSFYMPKTGSITCEDLIQTSNTVTFTTSLYSDNTKGIEYLQISNKCTSSCAAGTSMSFKCSNIKNRPSIKPITNSFTLRTQTSEGYNIDLGQITDATGLTLTTASFTQIALTSPVSPIVTGATDTYIFKITIVDGIEVSNTGVLYINFPVEIKLANAGSPTCSAVVGTTNLQCTVNVAAQNLEIRNSDASVNYEQQQITITLAGVAANPQTSKPSSKFNLLTKLLDAETNTYYAVAQDQQSLFVTSDTANQLTAVSVTRADFIINKQTDYVVSFKTFNPVPQGSKITITIPKDQMVISDSSSLTFTDNASGISVTKDSLSGQNDVNVLYYTLVLTEWCSNGAASCPGGTVLSLKIAGAKNPPNTKTSTKTFSIQIKTSEGYFTDEATKDVQALPLLSAGPFKALTLTESSSVVGEVSTLTIQVQLSNPITTGHTGKLRVKTPSQMYYKPVDSTQLLTCTSSGSTISCTGTEQASTLGPYYMEFLLNLNCQVESCLADAIRTFTISNIRNRLSTQQLVATISVQTLDDEDSAFDSSSPQISATSLASSLTSNHNGQVLTIVRSNSTVSQLTDITTTFQIAVRLPKNSFLQLFLPSAQFVIDPNKSPLCFVGDSSLLNDCVLDSTTNPLYHIIQLTEFCTNTDYCPEAYEFKIKATGFSNRYNALPGVDRVKFKTFIPGSYEVEESTNALIPDNNLLPALTFIESDYSLSSVTVGTTTTLTLNFNPQNTFVVGDFVIMTIDSQILRSPATSLTCTMSSSTQTTPLNSECSFLSSNGFITQIELKMPFTQSTLSKIQVKINNLLNLLEDKPLTSTISLNVLTKVNSAQYGISQGTLVISNNDLLVPAAFKSMSVARDNVNLDQNIMLTFTIQSAISILANSYLQISVPKVQAEKRADISLSCTFKNSPITCSILSEDADFIKLVTPKTLCPTTSDCPLNTDMALKITGLKNPYAKSTVVKYFTVTFISTNDYNILQTDQLNALPALKLGLIDKISIVQSLSFETNMPTKYQFNFRIPAKLQLTAKLFITFPQQALLPSTETLKASKVTDYDSSQPNQCSVYEQKNGYITIISIDDFCASGQCSALSTHSVLIENIKNIDYTIVRTESFTIQTVTSDNYITGEGFYQESNLSPYIGRTIDTLKVIREATKPGQSNVDLTISFVTYNQLPDRGTITYFLPFEQVTFQSFSKFSCYYIDRNGKSQTLVCTQLQRNQTHLVLIADEWCNGDCAIGTTMTMKITGTTNPISLDANEPQNSFGVLVQRSTQEATEQVFNNITITPPLDSVKINNFTLNRDSSVLGIDNNITFMFTLGEKVVSNVSLVLQLPTNTSFKPINSEVKSLIFKDGQYIQKDLNYTYYQNDTVYGLNPIQNITITDLCSKTNPCAANDYIIFKVPVSNPRSQFNHSSVNATNKFKIYLKGDKSDIGRGSLLNNLTQLIPNTLQASLISSIENAECRQTGLGCPIQLQITTSNPFIASGYSYIQVVLPDQISVIGSSCSATLNGTLSMSCRVFNQQTIQVRHSFNFSYQDYKSMDYRFKVDLQVNVRNPYTTAETSSFQISTIEVLNKTTYKIDELQQNLTYKVEEPRNISSISITRSNVTPSMNTKLMFEVVVDNQVPKEIEYLIEIPKSQIKFDLSQQSTQVICTPTVQSLFSNKNIKCTLTSDQTLLVTGLCMPSGCSANSKLQFTVSGKSLSNPSDDERKELLDNFEDSVKITSQYTAQNQTYYAQKTTNGVFINPPVNYTNSQASNTTQGTISISNISFSSKYLSDLQAIIIKAFYSNDSTFTQDYLRVRFLNVSFNVDLFYKIEASVNNKEAKMKYSESKSADGNSILDYIIIDCDPGNCKGKQSLSVEIKGFRNPYFKLNLTSNEAKLMRLEFAEMIDLPNKVKSSSTFGLSGIIANFTTNQLKSSQTSNENYAIRSKNNSLSILFTMENNPYVNENSTISVQLPKGYQVYQKNMSCSVLFTKNLSLLCNISTDGSIKIYGYFSAINNRTSSKIQRRRILQQSQTYTDGVNSNTVIAIIISNISNPSNASSSPITLAVDSDKKTYSFDNITLQAYSMDLSQNCTDPSCEQCNINNRSQCVECKKPSSKPLLEDFKCKETCSSGYFEYNLQCYKCPYTCTQCQTFDQCSSCNIKTQILVDGKCLDRVSKLEQTLQCPDGTYKSAEYGCVSQEGCTQTNCQICGVEKDYCHQCKGEQKSMNGLCISECPSGYTYGTNNGKCLKCESNCGTCGDDSKSCTSCRADYYEQVILDLKQNSCGTSCSNGTLLRSDNPFYCDVCAEGCNSCSGNTNNCTSCDDGMVLLSNGQCLRHCPSNSQMDYDSGQCKESLYSISSPSVIYLICSLLLMACLTVLSDFLTKRQDDSSSIVIVLLTQIEAINRVVLLAYLWITVERFSFTVTGMTLLANSILGIYFITTVIEAICKEIKSVPSSSLLFQGTIILCQFTGVNTARILASRFLNLQAFKCPKLEILTFFLRSIEQISAPTIAFNLFQILISISCISAFPQSHGAFGFAVNCIILNPILIGLQCMKYWQFKKLLQLNYQHIAQSKVKQQAPSQNARVTN